MNIWQKILSFTLAKTIFVVIILLAIVVSIVSPGYFIQVGSYVAILNQISLYGIVCIAMTFVILSGELDLSVGATYAFSAIVFTMAGNTTGSWIIGILAGAAAGLLVGVINGFLVAKAKINSIIVTLGMMSIVTGVAQIISDNQSIISSLPNIFMAGEEDLFGLTIPVWIFIGLLIICQLVLSKTRFGRNIYATGGNETVAKLTGIKTSFYKFIVFVILGLFTGIAGTLVGIRMASSFVLLGSDLTLYAIASVVLGGASMSGGKGTVVRTFFGVFFMGMMFATFNQVNISSYVQLLAKGLILILVIFTDYYSLKLRASRRIVT